jgi:hypothetical protein
MTLLMVIVISCRSPSCRLSPPPVTRAPTGPRNVAHRIAAAAAPARARGVPALQPLPAPRAPLPSRAAPPSAFSDSAAGPPPPRGCWTGPPPLRSILTPQSRPRAEPYIYLFIYLFTYAPLRPATPRLRGARWPARAARRGGRLSGARRDRTRSRSRAARGSVTIDLAALGGGASAPATPATAAAAAAVAAGARGGGGGEAGGREAAEGGAELGDAAPSVDGGDGGRASGPPLAGDLVSALGALGWHGAAAGGGRASRAGGGAGGVEQGLQALRAARRPKTPGWPHPAQPCGEPRTLLARPGERDETCPVSTGGGTRRIQLVRGEGRDVSS